MPIGDNDLASGVFFKDFGVVVQFGTQFATGNFDAPSKDAIFGGITTVSDEEYRVEVSYVAFSPMPDARSKLVIGGASYSVNSVDPVDDGKTVVLRMRRL